MHLTVLEITAITVLIAHFSLTLAYHLGAKLRILDHLDALSLVPKWHFFAPRPGMRNLYLLYRDRYATGDVSVWRVLHGMDRFRPGWSFIWNPDKRLRKTLYDVLVTLAAEDYTADDATRRVKLTAPYLLLLNHVSSLPRPDGVVATQFLVMEGEAGQTPRKVFCSELHPLCSRRTALPSPPSSPSC